MIFEYAYNKCRTLIILLIIIWYHLNIFFVADVFESYIVQRTYGVDACIWIKIQWLLFMKMHCMHLDKYICTIPIIVYMCCWYPNGCSF
jgi:hypothetical protein